MQRASEPCRPKYDKYGHVASAACAKGADAQPIEHCADILTPRSPALPFGSPIEARRAVRDSASQIHIARDERCQSAAPPPPTPPPSPTPELPAALSAVLQPPQAPHGAVETAIKPPVLQRAALTPPQVSLPPRPPSPALQPDVAAAYTETRAVQPLSDGLPSVLLPVPPGCHGSGTVATGAHGETAQNRSRGVSVAGHAPDSSDDDTLATAASCTRTIDLPALAPDWSVLSGAQTATPRTHRL